MGADMTTEDPQATSPIFPDIAPEGANLPAGIDRRAFMMRSALVGAMSVITGRSTPSAQQATAPLPPQPPTLEDKADILQNASDLALSVAAEGGDSGGVETVTSKMPATTTRRRRADGGPGQIRTCGDGLTRRVRARSWTTTHCSQRRVLELKFRCTAAVKTGGRIAAADRRHRVRPANVCGTGQAPG
jgi:hypothetical protein